MVGIKPKKCYLEIYFFLSRAVIFADHLTYFMTTVHTSYCVKKFKIVADWFIEYNKEFFVLKGPPQLLTLNHIDHIWYVVGSEIRIQDMGGILQNGKSRRMSNFEKAIAEYCRIHVKTNRGGFKDKYTGKSALGQYN